MNTIRIRRKFLVELLVKPGDWEPFHAILEDRQRTAQEAWVWLVERGYDISRQSVYRYVLYLQRVRDQGASINEEGDRPCRQRLYSYARDLSGTDLATVTSLASFLLHRKRAGSGGFRASLKAG